MGMSVQEGPATESRMAMKGRPAVGLVCCVAVLLGWRCAFALVEDFSEEPFDNWRWGRLSWPEDKAVWSASEEHLVAVVDANDDTPRRLAARGTFFGFPPATPDVPLSFSCTVSPDPEADQGALRIGYFAASRRPSPATFRPDETWSFDNHADFVGVRLEQGSVRTEILNSAGVCKAGRYLPLRRGDRPVGRATLHFRYDRGAVTLRVSDGQHILGEDEWAVDADGVGVMRQYDPPAQILAGEAWIRNWQVGEFAVANVSPCAQPLRIAIDDIHAPAHEWPLAEPFAAAAVRAAADSPEGFVFVDERPEGVLLSSAEQAVLLGNTEAGYPFLGFLSKGDGDRTWIGLPDRLDRAVPMWQVVLRNARSREIRVFDGRVGAGLKGVKVSDLGQGTTRVSLVWKAIAVPDTDTVVDVTVVAQLAANSPESLWWIHVVPGQSDWALWKVIFPCLKLGPIGGSGADDCLTIPCDEGRSVPNPSASPDMGGFGAAGPAANSFAQPPRLQDGGIPYPGQRGRMQFSSFYEKQGDHYYASEHKGPGLYFSPQDPNTYIKLMYYTPDKDEGTVLYELFQIPEDTGMPGTEYHSPYPFVVRAFRGDWFDASRIYQAWAQRQYWCRAGTLAHRGDAPDGVVRIRTWSTRNCEHGSVGPSTALEAVSAFGGPAGQSLYDWSVRAHLQTSPHTESNNSPLRSFPEMPGILETVRGEREKGVFFFPYFNPIHLSTTLDREAEAARPFSVLEEDGNRCFRKAEDPDKGIPYWIGMCQASEGFQSLFADSVAQSFARVPWGGLYLDEFSNGFRNICWDRAHGHPAGGGCHSPQGQIRLLRKIRDRIGHDVAIFTEGGAEHQIADTHGRLLNFDAWEWALPLYSAVYSEYNTAHMMTLDNGWYPTDADRGFFMHGGWGFVCGYQLGRLWGGQGGLIDIVQKAQGGTDGSMTPYEAEKAGYVRKLADAREKAIAFLGYGAMCRPPVVRGQPRRVVNKRFYGREFFAEMSLPAVLASTWTSPDGAQALAVTNVSDEPESLVFRLEMSSWHEGRPFTSFAGDKTVPEVRPGPDGWCEVQFPAGFVGVLSDRAPGEVVKRWRFRD